MALQNSIYAPTPFAVAKGGTGNSTAFPASLIWNFDVSGSPTLFVMDDFNGYTTQQSGIIFRFPTTAILGAIYKIQSYWLSSPGTGFVVQKQGSQSIQYNGVASNTLTTTNSNAAIEFMCTAQSGLTGIFTVINTNGATFVLT